MFSRCYLSKTLWFYYADDYQPATEIQICPYAWKIINSKDDRWTFVIWISFTRIIYLPVNEITILINGIVVPYKGNGMFEILKAQKPSCSKHTHRNRTSRPIRSADRHDKHRQRFSLDALKRKISWKRGRKRRPIRRVTKGIQRSAFGRLLSLDRSPKIGRVPTAYPFLFPRVSSRDAFSMYVYNLDIFSRSHVADK